jgi:signal transduction histidine kinase
MLELTERPTQHPPLDVSSGDRLASSAATALDTLGSPVCWFEFRSGRRGGANASFAALFGDGFSGSKRKFLNRWAQLPAEHVANCRGPRDRCGCDRKHAESARWFSCRSAVLGEGDAAVWMVTLTDMTTRRQEEQRRTAEQQRLQASSQLMSVSEVAATLGHELNQPLGSILNLLNGCLYSLNETQVLASDIAPALGKAKQQCDRARGIIARVKDLVGHRAPVFSRLTLLSVVGSVVELMDAELRQHRVELHWDFDLSLPDIDGDQVMLEQVVHNLVMNAIQAICYQTGPRIVSISGQLGPDQRVKLQITDNGAGCSDDVVAELFSPFFTTKRDGLGMGLNICRSIMELHGGSLVYVASQERGARFCASFPSNTDGVFK